MPAVQYPFIDIAVHERVREGFGRGEAMALFSLDLQNVLWANGRGAALFGTPIVYDFLEQGPKRQDVTFRQLAATAARLSKAGDSLPFTIRITSGFRSLAVTARAEIIEAEPGHPAILFSALTDQAAPDVAECARRMIEGFDDPDIHMAVLNGDNEIIAASSGFSSLGITPHTARTLIKMAAGQSGHLVKRPVPTGKGYLPAATGQITTSPELNLLFVVETALGTLDPVNGFSEDRGLAEDTDVAEDRNVAESRPQEMPAAAETALPVAEAAPVIAATTSFDSVLDAVAGIEDVEDVQELPSDFEEDVAAEQDEDGLLSMPDDKLETPAEPPALDADAAADMAMTDDIEDLFELDADETVAPSIERTVTEDHTLEAQAEENTVADDEITENEAEEATTAADEELTTETETADIGTAEEARPFVFNAGARASRFVWKIDAEGRFSSISHEFAEAVGAKAAAVEGMGFADVAALFNLDPDGKIRELLGRRDTWSGKTIYWPVEGTSLMVPIDLAALPTYTRAREFDGFRGFGIVRLADATEDPHATGLTFLNSEETEPAEVLPQQAVEDESHELLAFVDEDTETDDNPHPALPDEPAVDIDIAGDAADGVLTEEQLDDETSPEVESPIEAPAPESSYSDKVVHLEDRRSRSREGLTAGEQAAFREIGRALAPSDMASEEKHEADAEGISAEPVVQDIQQDIAAETAKDASSDTGNDAETTEPIEEDDLFADYVRGEQPAPVRAPTDEPASAEKQVATTDEKPVADIAASMVSPPVRTPSALTAETLDQMPVALLVHAGDRLIHANPDFLRLTGYTSLTELEEVGGLEALLQRQELENMPENEGGMVVVSAENDIIPVKARLQSIRWEETKALMLSLVPLEEKPAAVMAANENTAENAEAGNLSLLQGEMEELHSILETATDGVVLLGDDGEIRSLNRSASALFNYDNGEIVGKPFVTLFAHESQRAVLDYLSGLANNGVASVLNDGREVIGREASGGFLPLFMTIGRLKSSHGYCAVIRDITQWKRTEEELRNAKRAAETANAHKTDFLARVSHEIRTPLNAIIGFSDMMATERFGPIGNPRYVEYANDIGRSGRHVLDIVNDLLDISKIEAGQMDVDFIAVPLNETVAEAVSLVQPQANNQRVIIRTALAQSVPQIVADLRSIKQIVLNILSNAIRFTPSGGQIVVSTAYEANGSVSLRIRDTGIGMTRAELEQAMKPFRQVASSGKRVRGDGTGLGLPLTKAMVDANRANFSITSTPNEGTLVEITFPSQRVLAN
ncbi:PAS/PAC sensor signal transduction histidine kinase [Agrobacterium fabrum]|uniref:two-component system sensor histidine kinase PdhS1 n=1 Tax=Agrobacterium fabrum TaxID=1176649 RepID=UPI00087F5483|nr:two-component system sensor histidine kinase PdhS1 [Agrobacterium fabrum]MDH6294054.1 PAS domain S-box-containing protein [Agrobacterium fabrum]SDB33284.1 PAS/PAC sensor signal transduction histidine kinase [Agrobacterium fabrum]SEQ63722.1 PAS/PAC sensor signal transduction histidine kinase [Agrobacterium fabrum]